jgi:uncharacterized membrane protein
METDLVGFARNIRTVWAAAVILTIIALATIAFELFGIKLSYNSSAQSATPLMTLIVAIVVVIGVASLAILYTACSWHGRTTMPQTFGRRSFP